MTTATDTYAWVITKAYDLDDESLVGTNGPSDHDYDTVSVGEHGVEFRLYDGDGNLCFRGHIMGNYDGFEPLDNWARDGYGCTEIHYQDYYHVWKPL